MKKLFVLVDDHWVFIGGMLLMIIPTIVISTYNISFGVLALTIGVWLVGLVVGAFVTLDVDRRRMLYD